MDDLKIESRPDGCTISVHVTARAGRNKIAGVIDGALKLKIADPPVEGAANETCVRFLSELFDLPKSDVVLISGKHHKRKVIYLRGGDAKSVRAFLERALKQD